MKVIMKREQGDKLKACQEILTEIQDKMEADFPEITSYEVRE